MVDASLEMVLDGWREIGELYVADNGSMYFVSGKVGGNTMDASLVSPREIAADAIELLRSHGMTLDLGTPTEKILQMADFLDEHNRDLMAGVFRMYSENPYHLAVLYGLEPIEETMVCLRAYREGRNDDIVWGIL